MRPGDVLILTKPIGTGTLFAAHMRDAGARPLDRRGARVDVPVQSRSARTCLREHGATACTDLTGFGLLGHLVEMTRPSRRRRRTRPRRAAGARRGAEETAAAGILSSLQPANVRLRRALRNQPERASHPRYPLLFDPQTAGGLLASVPAARAQACLAQLRELGYRQAAAIGRVLPQGDALEPILLRG